jgi:hypothetical protein
MSAGIDENCSPSRKSTVIIQLHFFSRKALMGSLRIEHPLV